MYLERASGVCWHSLLGACEGRGTLHFVSVIIRWGIGPPWDAGPCQCHVHANPPDHCQTETRLHYPSLQSPGSEMRVGACSTLPHTRLPHGLWTSCKFK